jgi:flagellin
MALTIGTNVASLQASAAASSVNRDLETSMARLSTGKRINSAADDAAGVAIASRLSSEIRGTDQAIRNALDGQALIDTAEGGHKEIEEILQRMREISVQAANDTNSAQDRGNLQAEMDALMTEIDRIAGVTTWAGNSVMDGGGSTSKTFSLQVGAATGTKNQIAVAIKDMSTNTTVANGGLGMTTTASAGNHGTGADGQMTVSSHTLTVVASQSVAAKYTNSVVTGDITASVTSNGTGGVKAVAADIVKQLNANANYIAAGVSAVDNEDGTFTVTDGTHKAHMLSKEGAMASITNIDAAMKSVSTQRSELGAISNRLSHTVSNMTNVSTNLSAARGGIEDADFALETTQLAKNQILQQASTAMLAQANASKQNVLSLLQN